MYTWRRTSYAVSEGASGMTVGGGGQSITACAALTAADERAEASERRETPARAAAATPPATFATIAMDRRACGSATPSLVRGTVGEKATGDGAKQPALKTRVLPATRWKAIASSSWPFATLPDCRHK